MVVRVDRDAPLMVVTIDRPERRNAVDADTALRLRTAFREFEVDDALAVAVLTGAGGTFCAGFDLKALSEASAAVPQGTEDGPMGPTRMRLAKPVVAAIEGYCVGGGLELALWCDLRVAAHDATFGVFNRRFGVPLIDGGTVRLARIAGQGLAMDMILTGRPVTAEEAARRGLVHRLAEPGRALPVARELALQLAAFPQAALRGDRLSLLDQWGMTLEEALANEHRRGTQALASGEARAGARRFAAGEGRAGGELRPGP